MKRYTIAQIMAAIASVMTIGGIALFSKGNENGMLLLLFGMLLAFVSYLFGGLGTAIKMSWGIARWGFVAVPFPANLLTVLVTFFLSLLVFFFVPIIPVRKATKEWEIKKMTEEK